MKLQTMLSDARHMHGSAVSRLLDAYRNYLQLLARMQLNDELRQRISPSDIVQESMIAAHNAFALFRGSTESELLAWLRKILASRLVDARRFHLALRRDVRIEEQIDCSVDQSALHLGTVLPQHDESPSQIAVRREQAVILSEALERLPQDYSEVIVQHHLEGRSFAEIASRLDRTVPSIKGTWARAMTRLRTEIGEPGHER